MFGSNRHFLKIWLDSSSQKQIIAQTIKDSFGDILITSKTKPNLIETDDGLYFVNKI